MKSGPKRATPSLDNQKQFFSIPTPPLSDALHPGKVQPMIDAQVQRILNDAERREVAPRLFGHTFPETAIPNLTYELCFDDPQMRQAIIIMLTDEESILEKVRIGWVKPKDFAMLKAIATKCYQTWPKQINVELEEFYLRKLEETRVREEQRRKQIEEKFKIEPIDPGNPYFTPVPQPEVCKITPEKYKEIEKERARKAALENKPLKGNPLFRKIF